MTTCATRTGLTPASLPDWIPESLRASAAGLNINGTDYLVSGPPQRLTLPALFAWVPFRISRIAGAIRSTFSLQLYRNPGTAALWVRPGGNDSTGNGTFATAYRSIWKAIQALTGPGTTIYIETGTYNRVNGWKGESPAYDVNLVAWGGPVYSTTEWESGATPASWTNVLASGNPTPAWRAARSTVMQVVDKANIDPDYALPRQLTQVATEALCIATPGSYWIDATSVTAHLYDGRQPDANISVLMGVANGYTASPTSRIYAEGISFIGGLYAAFKVSLSAPATTALLAFKACEFAWAGGLNSPDADGLGAVGIPLTLTQDCFAHSNIADGFSYHSANGVTARFIEDYNIGARNGLADGIENDQTSTAHEDVVGFRRGVISIGPIGAGFKDVHNSNTYNLHCHAERSRAISGTPQSGAAFVAINQATQYIDTCTVGLGLTAACVCETTAGARQFITGTPLPQVHI